MDPLLHLNRTLDELDPPRWTPPAAGATHVVRKVHELWGLPLSEPLLDAYFYEGDLLLAAVNAPASAWALLPDLGARLRTVITTLAEAGVADMPRGAAEELARFVTRPESLR